MRFKLLCLFFLVSFFINAQSLVISQAKLPSGDEEILLEVIGHTNFHEIACISTDGKIYSYDGRQLNLWTDYQIKNINLLDSIYLTDSLLYTSYQGKFYKFDKKSSLPIKVSKKEVKKSTPFPWHLQTPNSSNLFSIALGKLSWTNTPLNIKTSTLINSSSNLVTSSWNKPYFLKNNKLFYATPIPRSYEKNALIVNNSSSLKALHSSNLLFHVYPSFINIPSFSLSIPIPQDIHSPENIVNILPLHSPSTNTTPIPLGFLIASKHPNQNNQSTFSIYFKDKHHILSTELNPSDFTSITLADNTLLFTTSNKGIYTCPLPTEGFSLKLSKHKLNSSLKNYKFIESKVINKQLYFFTENKGALRIDGNTLSFIKSNRKIKKVLPHKKGALLISENGELLLFDELAKKINHLKKHIPASSINTLLFDKENLYYTDQDSLFTLNFIKNTITHKLPYQVPLDASYIKDKRITAFVNNDKYNIYPTAITPDQAPILQKAFVKTSKNITHKIYPQSKTIRLTTDDYPLQFWAEAAFLENPSSIEYKYSWSDSKVKSRPFRFDNSYLLQTKLIGTAAPKLSLKSGNSYTTFQLSNIETTRVSEAQDYTGILYAAAGIIGLLMLTIFYGLYRNRKQKAKIEKLEQQKRMMEMEQKALQMQMNPHFIFNSLNGVKGMIALGNNKNAKEYLTKISGWMRNMLNDSRTNKVKLEDEVKSLSLYLDIERKLRNNSFDYHIDFDTADASIFIPSMMIQPFLENAIIHAFKKDQPNAKISINFLRKGRKIIATIEDNGQGMTTKTSSHKSVAMELIKERLSLWDGSKGQYGVEVINKSLEKHQSTGVMIELRLPIM